MISELLAVQICLTLLHLIYIHITKNNIKISIVSKLGDVIHQKTAGSGGYRSEESNSSIASSGLALQIATELELRKITKVGIYFKGVTSWKIQAIENFLTVFTKNLIFIRDISGIPHNGCSPQKKARKKQHLKKKQSYKEI